MVQMYRYMYKYVTLRYLSTDIGAVSVHVFELAVGQNLQDRPSIIIQYQ